ncbi:hypothetical protein F53441_6015 [Fusarium austroafricanum]|uniref:Uncharacterized protein n=1 Tax=Fusarium austroafricanum TaxID=2364996 RepID=A0A8H4KKK1_9HYPO|nr:hypothetical protein F53441_6015 [Fusarium austroafricanum]
MSDASGPSRRSPFSRVFQRSKPRNRSSSPRKVDQFLRRRVDSFRDAPPGPTQYDDNEQRYKPQDSIAVKDLERILDAHDCDATDFKVSDSSWNTVFNQIADAKRRHEQKSDNNSKAEVGLELASSYIDLVPDEYGLGVLKGGLALIFNV